MMTTKQIIEWLRDHAKGADFTRRRVMVAAADRLELFYSERWIPVSERLPEPMEWVLCACRANIIEVLRYDHIMDDWDTTMPNRCYMKGFVTHWIPLPEPPKESDK